MTPESYTVDIASDRCTPRRWLRPRWYIVNTGHLISGGPYPHTFRVAPVPDPERACARCGVDKTEGMGFSDPDGFHCEPCHDVLHPWVAPSRWERRFRRSRDRWGARMENTYFRWCLKFGKIVSQDAELRAADERMRELVAKGS